MSDQTDGFDYSLYVEVVNESLFTGIVFGIYIVVYLTSVYILLSKPGFTSSRPRMIMFGVTTLGFALGSTALALERAANFRLAKLTFDPTLSDSSHIKYMYAWATIASLTYILCDSVCAWRAVIIWNKDKRVIATLVIYILGNTVSAACSIAFGLKKGIFFDNYSNPSVARLASLMVSVPTLGSNMLSTGFIAWKAWQRRIKVRDHLCKVSGKGYVRVDRVFALLLESGFIHCFIWVLYSISKSGKLPNPGFTVMAFVSGLYPTLIIILVSNEMSPIEHYSIHSNDMRFKPATALGPRRDGGVTVTQHIVTIGRGSTATCDSDTRFETPSTIFMKPFDEEGKPL